MGKPEAKAAALFMEGISDPPLEKGGLSMITYSDLIQSGIFIVALVNLCYQIFRDKID
jgi:hypothetical protein